MGTYCTTTSFADILIGTDIDTSTDSLLLKKIDLAESIIKGRLSKRYDLTAFATSTAIPPQIRNLCELLTEGFYYKSVSRGNEKAFNRGKDICQMAYDELDLLIKGDVALVNTAGSTISEKEDGRWDMTSSTIDYNTTFDEDEAKHWKVDPDKISDIADERG